MEVAVNGVDHGMRRRCGILGFAFCVLMISSIVAKAGVMRGNVVDRAGKPVGGASVWAGRWDQRSPLEVTESSADERGRFQIELSPGSWWIWARRGDEGSKSRGYGLLQIDEVGDPEPILIRLQAPSHLRGQFLDAETERPIAGGRLALDDARVITADAQGRFEVPALEMISHEAYPLCAGYQRRRVVFDTSLNADADLVIRLPRGSKLVGRVTGRDGRPIRGASVSGKSSWSPFAGAALWERCDDDGRFTWDGWNLGRDTYFFAQARGHGQDYQVVPAALEGDEALSVSFSLGSPPRDSTRANAEIELAPNDRDVNGTVVSVDGKAIAGARVLMFDPGGGPSRRVVTDSMGRFRFEKSPSWRLFLMLFAPPYQPVFLNVASAAGRDVKVTLEEGTTVRGRVRAEDGSAIAGADVVPWFKKDAKTLDEMHSAIPREFAAQTDSEGRFTLSGMPRDGATYSFFRSGMMPLLDHTLDAGAAAQNEITLLAPGGIRGRVVDPLGKPVEHFEVRLKTPISPLPGEQAARISERYVDSSLIPSSRDGTFVVSGLDNDSAYRVCVVAPGFGVGEHDRVLACPIDRLTRTTDVTIKLVAAHSLRVRVSSDKPIKSQRRARYAHRKQRRRRQSLFSVGMALRRPERIGWSVVRRGRVRRVSVRPL